MSHQRGRPVRRAIALLVALASIAAACSGDDDEGDDGQGSDPDATTTTVEGASNTPTLGSGSSSGSSASSDSVGAASGPSAQLGLRLSEGAPVGASQADAVTVTAGAPLDDAAIDAVRSRLPEWDVPDDDVAEVARPAESLAPPTVGDTIDVPFPADGSDAPDAPDATPDGPLEVVRFQPESDVDVAPFLAVTFSEPMVELQTVDQLADAEVPVEIEPAVDGRWRWIGTRTARFEVVPDADSSIDRLPAATEYTVTVPSGTVSANGAELGDDVTWSFATPAPTGLSLYGTSESMELDPVFVATFDQRVDAESVIEAISFDAGPVGSVRLATDAEIDADDRARSLMSAALPDRAVAFVATESLPRDTAVDVRVRDGVRSLEGPRPGTGGPSASGRTYGPLDVVGSDCGGDRCRPLDVFSIEFSNALDLDAFDPATVTVEPGIPGFRVDVGGRFMTLSGVTSGDTDYEVTLDASIVDVFGQTLGDDDTETFRVGRADPGFFGPESPFLTLDPLAPSPNLGYTTVNHDALRITAWRVEPDEYQEVVRWFDDWFSDTRPDDPDWPEVLDTVVDVDAAPDSYVETAVDLSDAFDGSDGGPIVIRVEPDPEVDPRSDDWWRNRPRVSWMQSTTLGVDVVIGDEMYLWTTDLTTGEPVGGVEVDLLGSGTTVTTDSDGLASTPFTQEDIGVLATDGDRAAMLPADAFAGWGSDPERRPEARWYTTTDRGVYRPGETVRLVGLLRDTDADAQLVETAASSVGWIAYDPRGVEIASGDVDLNGLGGFDLEIDLPEGTNAGQGWIELSAGDRFWQASFSVQDFRTPEFEVEARAESEAPYYVVEPATVAVEAEYFSGGPLPGADVDWRVSTRDSSYSPPGWDDFVFGEWTPWWWFGFDAGFEEGGFVDDIAVDEPYFDDGCAEFDCGPGFPVDDPRIAEFSGITGSDGIHYLQIDFADTPASNDPDDDSLVDLPTTVTAESTVFDVNRQAFSSRTSLLVHPARYYVGLRTERSFVRQGEPLVVDAVVTDVDGETVSGRDATVTAGRVEFARSGGRSVEEIVDPQTCEITSTDVEPDASDDESMRCEFDTEIGGQYRITAIVTDDDGRSSRTETTQWVSGATATPDRGLERGTVTVVPDADEYAPGDTAELLVQAPFAPASGLMTVTRAGIESVTTFDAPDGSAVVEVPIADDDVPNLDVRIDMVGAADRVADDGTPLPDAPQRPAFAVGSIRLPIPPLARTLDVDVEPLDEFAEPGSTTSVTVAVTGPDGEVVDGAGVAVIAVDEAVLSLTGFELADPISSMYRSVSSRVFARLLRDSIVLAAPEALSGTGNEGAEGADEALTVSDDAGGEAMEAMEEEAADGDAAAPADDAAARSTAQATSTIDVRSDFSALALFAPDEVTGSDGTATVEVDLPDNLTRYRLMAVAVDGVDRFGSGESTLTARLPVQIRPSAPRFLNFGDRIELPVVVQNRTDAAVEVDVVVEAANLDLIGDTGTRVTVPADDRVEVRFDAATAEVGTARIRVAAATVGDADRVDAAEVALPVYTPATAEAFATYGTIDGEGPIAQPVLAPTGVIPQIGGLEISTSSTALQALTDAVLYLHEYRYRSSDGIAARIMAIAALRDVLDAFDAEGLPSTGEIESAVATDLEDLAGLQNGDGGFPSWQRGRESVPWNSVVATHAMVLARDNAFDVDGDVLTFALDHIRDIESFFPSYYSQSTRDAISAYALYVRDLAGDPDPGKAVDLYRSSDDLQLDALARLWPVIDDGDVRDEIRRTIENSAVETAGAATFATDYGEDAYLIAHSDRRTDGIVLGALVSEAPESDLIAKAVAGLLGNQTEGRWNNAYENAFILLALNDYFDTFESVDPDFVARAWLGDTYAAEAEFRGRSIDTTSVTVPMAELIDTATASESGDDRVPLVVGKEGDGRLYYRLGLRYAPSDLDLDPRDEGFVVQREYEAVDDPDDVVLADDGTWEIRAGASVRVRLTMVADARRTHVALLDPMAGGFEAVNPAFATSVTVPLSEPEARSGGWWWRWYEHQNLLDDRAEAFTSYLPGGTFEYTYVVRATTPGEFVVPPTRAEEIFAPEVFGRSGTDRVTITDVG